MPRAKTQAEEASALEIQEEDLATLLAGKSAGGYDNFALGFWTTGNAPAGVMGRPVGLTQAKDGSLLVADDVGNAIWRISYDGK